MILYGAGGHGKVVSTACIDTMSFFFDQKSNDVPVNGFKVIQYNAEVHSSEPVVVTIGNNKIRKIVSESIGHDFTRIVHQTSIVDSNCSIGNGCQILHGSIIQIGTIIGAHTIINTAASIDHDCHIGDYVHIAPNSTLCGNVVIGEGTLIGAGTTIIPGVKIGKWCVIGAGTVVVNDIPDNVLAYGNPSKIIKKIE